MLLVLDMPTRRECFVSVPGGLQMQLWGITVVENLIGTYLPETNLKSCMNKEHDSRVRLFASIHLCIGLRRRMRMMIMQKVSFFSMAKGDATQRPILWASGQFGLSRPSSLLLLLFRLVCVGGVLLRRIVRREAFTEPFFNAGVQRRTGGAAW